MCADLAYLGEKVELRGDFESDVGDESILQVIFACKDSGKTYFPEFLIYADKIEITVPDVPEGTFTVMVTHDSTVICQHEFDVPSTVTQKTRQFVLKKHQEARCPQLQKFYQNLVKTTSENAGVLLKIKYVHIVENPEKLAKFSYAAEQSEYTEKLAYNEYLQEWKATCDELLKHGADISMVVQPIDEDGAPTLGECDVQLPKGTETLQSFFGNASYRLPGVILVSQGQFTTYRRRAVCEAPVLEESSDEESDLSLDEVIGPCFPGAIFGLIGKFPCGILEGHQVIVFDNGFYVARAVHVGPAKGQPTTLTCCIPFQMRPGKRSVRVAFGNQETNALTLTVEEVPNLPDEEEELPAAAPVAQPYDEDETEELESPSKRRKMPY
jgi:hypothetical protein